MVEELLRNSLDKAYGKQGTALRVPTGGACSHIPLLPPALRGLLVPC